MMPQPPPHQPHGYPQPGGAPGGVGAQPPQQEKHGGASLSFWLGLASFVSCGFSGIPALILGLKAKKEIAAQPGRYKNALQARAGVILGIIGCILAFLFLVGSIKNKDKSPTPGAAIDSLRVATVTPSPIAAASGERPNAPSVPENKAVPEPPAAPRTDPLAALPAGERSFCAIVQDYAQRYKDADGSGANQLKLSKLRTGRMQALLKGVGATVSGWLGTIDDLSTNSEGKATVKIKLPCDAPADIVVMTWNNALSDINDNTLIPQSSKLFDALSDIGDGKAVKFGGNFISSEKDGYEESSVTESGSMGSPEFILRFSSVTAPKT